MSVTSLKKRDSLNSHPGSIAGRLTVLYTVSASILLVSISAFLYWALVTNLREEDKQLLADKVHTLQRILQEHDDAPIYLEQEIKWEAVSAWRSPNYAYYSRILDQAGNVLIETPDMSRIIPSAVFPLSMAHDGKAALLKRFEFWKTADNRPYLLISAQTTNLDREKRVIQIALDISREDALIADYRYKLSLALLFGLLSSAAIGAKVAHRGMRPLQEITRAAQLITASQLHERIEPSRWPGELMSLAEAFDQMLGRLEDSFSRLSQFSADLAHELRTPINNLMGEAEVALSRHRSEADYRQVLESCLEECGRLSRMVDSLLFLARADNDQVPLKPARLEVRKELEAIREFYAAAAEEQGVAIHCEGEAVLVADPILFRRAVANLLANALRHTPAGGQIKLVVAHTNETDGVEVCVSDTGCGIAPEHLPKVFDRFYRADQARSADSNSAGLGLAIVKSILAMHGGTVSIHSQPGQGTTVTLHFPAHLNRDPVLYR